MTPPISEEEERRTIEAYHRHSGNQTHIAAELGKSRGAIQDRLKRLASQGKLGTAPVLPGYYISQTTQTPNGGQFIQQKPEHGEPFEVPPGHTIKGVSALVDADGRIIQQWFKTSHDAAPEELADRLKSAFADLPKAPPIPAPKHTNEDLLTLYPLFDVHMGMHAWGEETGYQNYNLKLAVSDIHSAIGNVMALSPHSEEAILLVGGDYYHGDDSTNQTPAHRNPLDVDGRHFKVLDTGIEVIAATIERLVSKHRRVRVRVLRGNHDPHSHMVLTLALAQRYRSHDRITIDKDPRDIFMHQWGKCLIAAHHGDKQKPERLAMILAEICPFWSESPHRIVFTGHRHSQKADDFPGIEWEQFRAFCPPDAYGAQFAPRRAMHAITFQKQSGIATRAKDPIRRAA